MASEVHIKIGIAEDVTGEDRVSYLVDASLVEGEMGLAFEVVVTRVEVRMVSLLDTSEVAAAVLSTMRALGEELSASKSVEVVRSVDAAIAVAAEADGRWSLESTESA